MSDVIVMISETRYFFVKLVSSFNMNIVYFSMVIYN